MSAEVEREGAADISEQHKDFGEKSDLVRGSWV